MIDDAEGNDVLHAITYLAGLMSGDKSGSEAGLDGDYPCRTGGAQAWFTLAAVIDIIGPPCACGPDTGTCGPCTTTTHYIIGTIVTFCRGFGPSFPAGDHFIYEMTRALPLHSFFLSCAQFISMARYMYADMTFRPCWILTPTAT